MPAIGDRISMKLLPSNTALLFGYQSVEVWMVNQFCRFLCRSFQGWEFARKMMVISDGCERCMDDAAAFCGVRWDSRAKDDIRHHILHAQSPRRIALRSGKNTSSFSLQEYK